jgi:CDP-diglyceride synthetase
MLLEGANTYRNASLRLYQGSMLTAVSPKTSWLERMIMVIMSLLILVYFCIMLTAEHSYVCHRILGLALLLTVYRSVRTGV